MYVDLIFKEHGEAGISVFQNFSCKAINFFWLLLHLMFPDSDVKQQTYPIYVI